MARASSILDRVDHVFRGNLVHGYPGRVGSYDLVMAELFCILQSAVSSMESFGKVLEAQRQRESSVGSYLVYTVSGFAPCCARFPDVAPDVLHSGCGWPGEGGMGGDTRLLESAGIAAEAHIRWHLHWIRVGNSWIMLSL